MRISGKSDLIDIACEVRRDRPGDRTIAVADGATIEVDGRTREKWYFLPRDLVQINSDGTVTMPEWLALDRGLI